MADAPGSWSSAGADFARLQGPPARCPRCPGSLGVACCRWCQQWYLGCAGCADDPRQCPDCRQIPAQPCRGRQKEPSPWTTSWCRHCGDALDPDDAPEAFAARLCVECYDVAHYEATGWLEEDEPCPP